MKFHKPREQARDNLVLVRVRYLASILLPNHELHFAPSGGRSWYSPLWNSPVLAPVWAVLTAMPLIAPSLVLRPLTRPIQVVFDAFQGVQYIGTRFEKNRKWGRSNVQYVVTQYHSTQTFSRIVRKSDVVGEYDLHGRIAGWIPQLPIWIIFESVQERQYIFGQSLQKSGKFWKNPGFLL